MTSSHLIGSQMVAILEDKNMERRLGPRWKTENKVGRWCMETYNIWLASMKPLLNNYAPIKSKLQHLPRKARAFQLLKIGLLKLQPPRAKMVFKCPTLSSDLSVKCPPKTQLSPVPVVCNE